MPPRVNLKVNYFDSHHVRSVAPRGSQEREGELTALAMSSTERGGLTLDLKDDPRLASHESSAAGKTRPVLYRERLTSALRLLSLVPSGLTSRPRCAKMGGVQPKAW